MPFKIAESKLTEFGRKFSGFGEIRGSVCMDEGCRIIVFDTSAGAIERGKRITIAQFGDINSKLGPIIGSLEAFGVGTSVRIITDPQKSLFYNKDDRTLEIHAALLLDGVSDKLLSFCCQHEARHAQIEGISPFLEEVLNIYMDMDSLDKMPPAEAEGLLNNLADLEEGGKYAGLLRKRALRRGKVNEKNKLLNELLDYVLSACTWIVGEDGRGLGVSRDQMQELIKQEVRDSSFLNMLFEFCNKKFDCSLGKADPVHTSIPELSSVLFGRMNVFADIAENCQKISDACDMDGKTVIELSEELSISVDEVRILLDWRRGEISGILSGGGQGADRYIKSTTAAKKQDLVCGYDPVACEEVYVEEGSSTLPWARGFLLAKRLVDELQKREDLTDTQKKKIIMLLGVVFSKYANSEAGAVILQMYTAIAVLQAGGNFNDISAALVYRSNIDELRNEINRIRIPCAELEKTISNYREMKMVFDYKIGLPRHGMQNVFNLLIQISQGDAGSFMLLFMDWIAQLEYGIEYDSRSSLFDGLQARMAVEFICAPMAEMLGRNDIARKLRNLFLRLETGAEDYKVVERYICGLAGFPSMPYQELPDILEKIVEKAREKTRSLSVEIRSRVKSPYSVNAKNRQTRDIFGITFVIKGSRTADEIAGIRKELSRRLSEIFVIFDEDSKRFTEKQYNEYDFIATYVTSAGEDLAREGISLPDGIEIEVQIYPTEDDYQRYMFGPFAHWLYKLETMLKKAGISGQLFDRDVLEGTYKKMKPGDLAGNLKIMYGALKEKKFVGVIKGNVLKVIRAVGSSIAPDVGGAVTVNSFNRRFKGIRRIGEQACVPNDKPDKLLPGIYIIDQCGRGREGLSIAELEKINRTTRKPRTFLLASQMIMEQQGGSAKKLVGEGKRTFSGLIEKLKPRGAAKEYAKKLLKTIVLERTGDGFFIGMGLKALSVENQEMFFSLIAMVSESKSAVNREMLKELTRRVFYYLTGKDIGDDIDFTKLKRKWGIKKGLPDVAVLVYLFTLPERGRLLLNSRGYHIDDETDPIISALFDEFEVDGLQQLYSCIGLEENLADIAKLRLDAIHCAWPPKVNVKVDEEKLSEVELSSEIKGIIEGAGIVCEEDDIDVNKEQFVFTIKPVRYWLERMDKVLRDIRSLKEVKTAELAYEEQREKRNLNINLGRDQKNRIESLFRRLRVSFLPPSRNGNSYRFGLEVPKGMKAEDLRSLIQVEVLGRGRSDQGNRRKTSTITLNSPVIALVLALSIGGVMPWIVASAIVAFAIIIYAFLWNMPVQTEEVVQEIVLCSPEEDTKLGYYKKDLLKIWAGYGREKYPDTPLLDPFYKEEPEGPNVDKARRDIDACLNDPDLRVCKVESLRVRKDAYGQVSFMSQKDECEVQGYIIQLSPVAFKRKGKNFYNTIHEIIVVGQDCIDIGYKLRDDPEDTFYSLGPKFTVDHKDEVLGIIRKHRPIPRMAILMFPECERPEFERFVKNSIFARSVIERFLKRQSEGGGGDLPALKHKRYTLSENEGTPWAYYMPKKDESGRGLVSKALLAASSGLIDLHEIVHGIFDYFGGVKNGVLAHFRIHKNKSLERTIKKMPEYEDCSEEDLANECFAYSLSAFAAMQRPFFGKESLKRLRKRVQRSTLLGQGIGLLFSCPFVIFRFGIVETIKTAVDIIRTYNAYRSGLPEEQARQRYFEIHKKIVLKLNTLPIRLKDVRFFACCGIIDPWMDPLELGFSLDDLDEDVDTEYYLRIMEFLYKRYDESSESYTMRDKTTVSAPYGDKALDAARRIGRELVYSESSRDTLSHLTDSRVVFEELAAVPDAVGTIDRIAKMEIKYNIPILPDEAERVSDLPVPEPVCDSKEPDQSVLAPAGLGDPEVKDKMIFAMEEKQGESKLKEILKIPYFFHILAGVAFCYFCDVIGIETKYFIMVIVMAVGYFLAERIVIKLERIKCENELFDLWLGDEKGGGGSVPELNTFFIPHSESFGGVDINGIFKEGFITDAVLINGKDGRQSACKVSVRFESKIYEFLIIDNVVAYKAPGESAKYIPVYALEGYRLEIQKMYEFIEKTKDFVRQNRCTSIERLVMTDMSREQKRIEQLCRVNAVARAVFKNFPSGEILLPAFCHNVYRLEEDMNGPVCRYYPWAHQQNRRGIFMKAVNSRLSDTDIMYAVAEAMTYHDNTLLDKALRHFRIYPNHALVEYVEKKTGIRPVDVLPFARALFAETLANFATLRLPGKLPGVVYNTMREHRKWLEYRDVAEIRDSIQGDLIRLEKIFKAKGSAVYSKILEITLQLYYWYSDYTLRKIDERELRNRFIDGVREIWDLSNYPPIRFIDAVFFAEAEVIDLWMHPVELGASGKQVMDTTAAVNVWYYLLIAGTLFERAENKNRRYKMTIDGRRLFDVPCGTEAVDMARRLALEALKVNYGLERLSDVAGNESKLGILREDPLYKLIFSYVVEQTAHPTGDSLFDKMKKKRQYRALREAMERCGKRFEETAGQEALVSV